VRHIRTIKHQGKAATARVDVPGIHGIRGLTKYMYSPPLFGRGWPLAKKEAFSFLSSFLILFLSPFFLFPLLLSS
jgi:hypothetical protein